MSSQHENQNIEFKSLWKDEYLKWICGFANADGGIIYIGKDDTGKVIGVENFKTLLEQIPNKVRDTLGIIVDVNLGGDLDKNFIEIIVEPHSYPISYQGKYHYRSGSTKQELKGLALDTFLLKKQGRTWDSVPVPKVKVSELKSIDLFRDYAIKSKRIDKLSVDQDDQNLLEKLRLYDGDYLKRAAVLLFHSDPEKYISGAYIKIGFFESDSDLIYQDEIHGNLLIQAQDTLDLLTTKYLKASITYDGLQRSENLPVPLAALREALLNAIVHKNYSINVPIQISVYSDKLMIWNAGELQQGWTVNKLFSKHESIPYNPEIANTFFRAGLIEAWGRGIEKMTQECLDHNLPKPDIKYEETGIWLTFEFEKSSVKSSVKSSDAIVMLLKENPELTVSELAQSLDLSDRAIEKNLQKLQRNNQIKRAGSNRSGYWEIL